MHGNNLGLAGLGRSTGELDISESRELKGVKLLSIGEGGEPHRYSPNNKRMFNFREDITLSLHV